MTVVARETVQELALFDASTSGSMFLRAVVSARAVLPTDTIPATITVTNN